MKGWEANIRKVVPYVPGEQPQGDRLIKLNTNENPYPPSQKALAAIREAAGETLRLYPDPECTTLRELLGATYGLKPEQIFVGNGSDEVLALCGVDRRITPCIDFGHLNARDGGWIKGKEQYAFILDRMAEALGDERAVRFHVHFSRIEYTTGGEKRHLTFADTVFGPPFEPLMEVLWQRRLAPVIVCESAGTQAEDAATMKRYYQGLAGG